ncbi:MAG TPA: hypothetical protein VJ692_13215 [Nitrospiraceae bacterium]|nr:hypothetical protein [Nitrospiraceae bacterium]
MKVKNKPNWDSYDSWGGMLPFNRDRIYQGSVEVAAFRKIFNPWTWRANPDVRSIIEQLELQPPGVPPAHAITPTTGGTNDGHINFGFDTSPPVLTEPAPTGADPAITTSYSFDGATGTGPATSVTRGGSFVTLHHSNIPMSDEGRGVRFFDALGGLVATTRFNQQRIADELISHRFATGSVPIDVRPIALAISTGCVSNPDTLAAPGTTARAFFDARNGMSFSALETDTRTRRLSPTGLPTTRQSLPRRKADIEKINLNRTGDPYLDAPTNGLIQQYGAATTAGTDTSPSRLRQEVFRRPIDLGLADVSGMGGVYVDREDYETSLLKENTKITLFRYFLEPLGVSVDKWSMGVRGRSRAYTFADVFGGYISVMNDLAGNSYLGHVATTTDCAQLIADSGAEWSRLPSATAVPTYTDVQRIFNKSCIECHGGLGYPPYSNHGSSLDLSEDESPAVGGRRLDRSHSVADPLANFILQRVTNGNENCPNGRMPCGGPPLSQVDIETIRRWINGGRPYTEGDPHIKTIDGVNYDFQSAGEFVLLRGENLEIQARQTAVETESPLGPNPHTGLTSCVSINTAMAVRIGPHRITYEPNLSGEPDPTGLQLRIDGQLTKMSTEEILLASGGRIVGTTAPGGIQIESPGGTVVVITPGWWDHYELWYLNIDARHARATEGVMGSIAPGNWLPALPDGGLMGPRPADLHQRYLDLYEKFADAWRVRKATSLFDYAPGTSTKTFTLDSWPGESPRSCTLPQIPGGTPKKSPQKPLKPEVAKQYCSAIVAEDRRANCVQDVMVTGEPGFAKTYLLTQQIERNAMPRAPLLLSPENFKAGLPRTVTFTWKKAADSDGDPVTYKHCLWGVDKQFAETDCTAVSNHTRGRGIIYAWLVGLGGSSLVVGLIFARMKNRRGLLSLMAITMLTAIIISSCSGGKVIGGTDIVSKTVSGLESDKVYFWKVIAEDGKGGRAESETWRFTTK